MRFAIEVLNRTYLHNKLVITTTIVHLLKKGFFLPNIRKFSISCLSYPYVYIILLFIFHYSSLDRRSIKRGRNKIIVRLSFSPSDSLTLWLFLLLFSSSLTFFPLFVPLRSHLPKPPFLIFSIIFFFFFLFFPITTTSLVSQDYSEITDFVSQDHL